MPKTKFGPGTLNFTVGTGTAMDFSAEVKSGGVNHAYEDIGDSTTYLDGSSDPITAVRSDSLSFEVDNDLTAAGLYAFLNTNDQMTATFEFTPFTTGATWTGTVQLRLPESVSGESFGAKMAGSIELLGVGIFTFTPAV